MKPCWIVVLVAALAVTVGVGVPAVAVAAISAEVELTPTEEVPVCAATGSGTFKGTLSADRKKVDYELTYTLEGTVEQAHIHLAQAGASGSIAVWLCQTASKVDPTGLAPTCPPSGTVTGSFTKLNVVGPVAQGIAGSPTGTSDAEFAQLLEAIGDDFTYANVHSDICPSGEIRGQIVR